MTITEIFDGKEWKIIFQTENETKSFDADEFPFTAKEITGKEHDEVVSFDPAGNPTQEIWHI